VNSTDAILWTGIGIREIDTGDDECRYERRCERCDEWYPEEEMKQVVNVRMDWKQWECAECRAEGGAVTWRSSDTSCSA